MHRIIFQLGSFTLYSYGLCVAGAFLLCTVLILKDSKKRGMSPEKVFDCFVAILIGGIVGARAMYVTANWPEYAHSPLSALRFYEGGLIFQGGLIAAVITAVVVTRIKKLSFWKITDLMAPYIVLGQAIGRIGCFLNGCCYGRIVQRAGITFPQEAVMRFPTQIYSSLFLLLLFMFLLWVRQKRSFDGSVFMMYIIIYSVFRFLMEFMRGDEYMTLFGMRLSQVICIAMFACGTSIYAILAAKSRHRA
ncbi:MAG: prolipoprotein diacylglyceryl transferase [Candidatus Omnitrophota bacterium]